MVKEPVGIIGAGLIGLATARQLAQAGIPVRVWEKEAAVARHQSGHNSGVVHAGIYYQPGSAKAKNCRRGVELLRAYCAGRGCYRERQDGLGSTLGTSQKFTRHVRPLRKKREQ